MQKYFTANHTFEYLFAVPVGARRSHTGNTVIKKEPFVMLSPLSPPLHVEERTAVLSWQPAQADGGVAEGVV